MSQRQHSTDPEAAKHRVVCIDDEGMTVFEGLLLYADGGFFGVACDDGMEREWPAELVHVASAVGVDGVTRPAA